MCETDRSVYNATIAVNVVFLSSLCRKGNQRMIVLTAEENFGRVMTRIHGAVCRDTASFGSRTEANSERGFHRRALPRPENIRISQSGFGIREGARWRLNVVELKGYGQTRTVFSLSCFPFDSPVFTILKGKHARARANRIPFIMAHSPPLFPLSLRHRTFPFIQRTSCSTVA